MPKATSVARLILGTIAAAFLGLTLVATPAFSHAQLIAVTPDLGSSQSDSPPEVRLTFNEELMDFGYAMVLSDRSSGSEIPTAEPVLAGPQIALPIDTELPNGQYRAAWRVVSADGHPISGVVDFAVGEDFQDGAVQVAGQANSGQDSQGANPTQGSGLGDSADAGDTASGTDTSSAADSNPAASSTSAWWRLPVIGLSGAALALAAWYGISRVRTQ